MFKYLIPTILLIFSSCKGSQNTFKSTRVLKDVPIYEEVMVVERLFMPHYNDGIHTKIEHLDDISSIQASSQWGVLLECDHGRFVLVGNEPEYEKLFYDSVIGNSMIIEYNEKYLVIRNNGMAPYAIFYGYDI